MVIRLSASQTAYIWGPTGTCLHLDSNRARKAVSLIQEELRTERHTGTVEYKLLDLASLESVRSCAKELIGSEGRIDILILNAGEGLSVV